MNNSTTLSVKPKKESNERSDRNEYAVILTMRGLMIEKNELLKILKTEVRLKRLCNKLVVVHHTFIGQKRYTKTMPIYKIISYGNLVYYVFALFSLVENHLASLIPNAKAIYQNKIHSGLLIASSEVERNNNNLRLHPNQTVVFEHILEKIYNKQNVRDGKASCIFVMDTGLGKTYIGGAFIEECGRKTLIIVPKTAPIPEWMDMLKKYFSYLTIGQYHATAKKDGDIVVMTIDSALRNDYFGIPYWKYFQNFGVVIFDEVHNYPTAKRQEVFWRTNFRYKLGLTATPDERADGMDPIASFHMGPIIRASNVDGFNIETINWIGKIKAIRYSGPPEFTKREVNVMGWVNTQAMCKQFIEDKYRNKLLLKEIKELYEAGKYIFVFSEQRDYLSIIQKKLEEMKIISLAPECEKLMGGSSADEKQNARAHARIILITYGYGMESISIPKMNAIIFATPRRRKMRQTLGRILRRSGDPSQERQIIDIIDEETSLRSQFNTRAKVYDEKNFPITECHVNWTSLDSF